jgi:hypothetical protein
MTTHTLHPLAYLREAERLRTMSRRAERRGEHGYAVRWRRAAARLTGRAWAES